VYMAKRGLQFMFVRFLILDASFLKLCDDSIVLHRSANRPIVALVTIDQMVQDLNLPRVALIELDIEGAEKQALAGGRETIRKHHPRVAIATEHLPDDPQQIPETIRSISPHYQAECGPCEYADNHIRAQVLYLY